MNQYIVYIPVLAPLVAALLGIVGFRSGKNFWPLSFVVATANLGIYVYLFLQLPIASGKLSAVGGAEHFYIGAIRSHLFSFSIDRLNMLFLLVASFAFLVIFYLSRDLVEEGRNRLVSILLFQVGLLGFFSSKALLGAAFFSMFMILPTLFFLGAGQSTERALAVRNYLFFQFLSALLLIFAVVGRFLLDTDPHLVSWLYVDVGGYEITARSILFFALCFGLLIRMPIFPFNLHVSRLYSLSHIEHLILIFAASTTGIYGLFRFGLDYYHSSLAPVLDIFAWFAVVSIFIAVCALMTQSELRQRIKYLHLFWASLCALGFFSFNRGAWVGALLATVAQFLITSVFLLLVKIKEERGHVFDLRQIQELPGFNISYLFIHACAYAFPLSIGFYGAYLIYGGIYESMARPFLVTLLVLPFLLYGFLLTLQRDRSQATGATPERDLSFHEMFPFLSFFLIFLAMAIYPSTTQNFLTSFVDVLFASIKERG